MSRSTRLASAFWSTDKGLSLLVLFLVATVFVLPPLMASGAPFLTLFFDISFSLVLLTGLTAVTRTRVVIIGGSSIVVLSLLGRWLSRAMPDAGLETINISMSILSTLILCGLVLRQVFREGPITLHRVLGAVAVYLLLGVGWGFVYQLIALFDPAGFTISTATSPHVFLQSEFLYFSFVTLTTVGFGDITAIHPVARSLVILEALTGSSIRPSLLRGWFLWSSFQGT